MCRIVEPPSNHFLTRLRIQDVVSNLHHRLRPVAPSHANLQLSQQHAVAHGQLFSRHDVLLSGLAENVVWPSAVGPQLKLTLAM
ncbi:hypothetical protein WJX82_009556 [Trebouxia sp. C0006]